MFVYILNIMINIDRIKKLIYQTLCILGYVDNTSYISNKYKS